jgi:hypothetical protein
MCPKHVNAFQKQDRQYITVPQYTLTQLLTFCSGLHIFRVTTAFQLAYTIVESALELHSSY